MPIHIEGIAPSQDVVLHIAREQRKTLLSFSCGKDALASWLAIRDHFEEVVPFYLFLVPGLEFVETSLTYYERFFGTRIRRVASPSFYRLVNGFVFQAPERCAIIEAADPRRLTYEQAREELTADEGLPADTFYASGVRVCDSPNRRAGLKRYGPINARKRVFYPIWDWTKGDVIDALRQASVRLPIDYRIFGRSFDGIDFRFLAPIKKHFPSDYARILEFFPLAELELFRAEQERA